MRGNDRIPTWQTNLKWLAGLLLTLSVMVFMIMFALERISTEQRSLPLIETILSVTLVPDGGLAAAVTVGDDPDAWEPGTPLQLLAGADVFADATEVSSMTASQARERIAGVLTGELLAAGRDAMMALVPGQMLSERLEAAIDGPLRQLVTSLLASSMLDAGLGDGSRMANWQAQLQQQPGQPVQPIVGLLVRVDPELVAQQDAMGIGMLVLDGLAAEVIGRGVAGARELLANNTLLERFDSATGAPLGNSVHGLLSTLMLGNESAIQSRLDAAAASLAGAQTPEPDAAAGLPGAAELEGLSAAEAERVILARLAQVVHAQGAAAVRPLLTDDSQLERLAGVTWLLDRLDDNAHRAYRTRVWLAGMVSLFLALVLFAASSGWGRVFNPGLCVLLAAGPGLLALLALRDTHARLQGSVRPLAFDLEGGLLHAWRSQEHVFSLIPVRSLDLLVQDVSILASAGALLVLIAVLGLVVQAVRPRRGRL